MLKTRKTKLIVGLGGLLCMFAACTTIALAAGSDDTWSKGANSPWAATSSKTTFTSSVVTITCTVNKAGGSSVGSGPDIGPLAMNAPTFSSCTDNLGGTDTVTTKATGWKVAFISDNGNTKCPAGSGKDETSGSDCVVITVPLKAATIVVNALGCTLTVQPAAATHVGALVKDPGGTTKDSFILTNQPIQFSGCGTSGTANFSGTYKLTAPNSGVLVDVS
jgi:hypothetical protein